MAKSFAALMLCYAAGDVIDMAGPLRLFQVPPLRSLYEHLQSSALQTGTPFETGSAAGKFPGAVR